MKLPTLFPPVDLLEKVEGIEQGLRQRRRLSVIGLVGVIISSLASALPVANEIIASNFWQSWGELLQGHWSAIPWPSWLLFLLVAGLVISLLLLTWSRYWLEESHRSFHYTYSIDDFKPVTDLTDGSMTWLRHDLSARLSERIGRLALLDETFVKPAAEGDKAAAEASDPADLSQRQSHIHISGNYIIRKKLDDRWVLEVMPRVRIGPPGQPETLAHIVKFPLGELDDLKQPPPKPPELTAEDYQQFLLERVYFSVATQIYHQIHQDVEHKIKLLPTDHFRAATYFYEAEDYARSNTLDAYDEAAKLYYKAMERYDPRWTDEPESRLGHWGRTAHIDLADLQRWMRGWLRSVWPPAGQVEIMAARSEMGYAKVLLYRHNLAKLSGHRIKPIFEARMVARCAFERLKRLSQDVPGQRATLFDAHVTLALAWYNLGDTGEAIHWLQEARELAPSHAEQDASYLFAAGEVESNLFCMLPLYRRAVEADPTFEVAQYELAETAEMLWRTRHTFEPDVAKLILVEYQKVLELNPGNISAWAALGYIHWLLVNPEDKDQARAELRKAWHAFENGRQYKQITSETFVAALDYGLARIAAEEGNFSTAYSYYLSAVSANVAEGFSRAADGNSVYFAFIGNAMIERYQHYKETVQGRLCHPNTAEQTSERVRDNVYAFVLNDYGEACFNYYLRSGDETSLHDARVQFDQAGKKNHFDYAMPYYNLARCNQLEANLNPDSGRVEKLKCALNNIKRVNKMEPAWPEGNLALADIYVLWALDAYCTLKALRDEAAKFREEAQQLYTVARTSGDPVSRLLPKAAMARQTAKAVPEIDQGYQKAQSPLERKAAQKEEEAAQKEKEAAKLEQRIDETREQVREILARLLPHKWLWSCMPDSAVRRLIAALHSGIRRPPLGRRRAHGETSMGARSDGADAWQKWQEQLDNLYPKSLAGQTRFESRLKWLRELEDIHIQALSAWIRIVWMQVEMQQDQPGLEERLDKIARITRHVWKDFLPAKFDFLYDIRDYLKQDNIPERIRSLVDKCLNADDLCTINCKIATNIQGWFDSDPTNVLILSWIGAEYKQATFGDKYDPRRIFADAFCKPDLPASMYRWLCDQLWRGTAPDASEYQKWMQAAISRRDPASLYCLAQKLEDSEQWLDSLRAYQAAREYDLALNPPVNPQDKYTRCIAGILWIQSDYDGMRAELAALSALARDRDESWRAHLVESLRKFKPSRAQYNQIRSWLDEERRQCAARGDAMALRDAQQAVLLLVRSMYQTVLRNVPTPEPESSPEIPPVLPILIAAHAALFPADWDWKHDPLFTTYLPEMRERLRASTGVPIPDPQIHSVSGQIEPGDYLLMLYGMPMAGGKLPLNEDERFCPRADLCPGLEIIGRAATNPCDGSDGLWLERPAWERANEAGLPLWPRYLFMILHLESLLYDHLAMILDFQTTHELLKSWTGDVAERRALYEQALPDNAARIRLVQVIQSLLDESVPIKNLDVILTACSSQQLEHAPARAVVEHVRTAVRQDLPGNSGDRSLIALAPDFEDTIGRQIVEQDGRRYLALAAEDELSLLDALRSQIAGRMASDLALVVQQPDLRPFVRRLIRENYPRLSVLAIHELADGLEPDEWVEYVSRQSRD
jgi:hypothetical protein